MSRWITMKAFSDKNSPTQPTGDARIKKPILRRGASGLAVIELQKLLMHWEVLSTSPDGLFDKKVEAAVKAFQHRVFLKEDGIVESLTWQALYTGVPINMPILQRDSQGEAVITLQTVLQGISFFRGEINGKFGLDTDASVRAFQKRYGLVPDGIVGAYTWLALSKVPH